MPLYIGLLSGTSLDSIDSAIVEISDTIKILYTNSYPIPEEIKKECLDISQNAICKINDLGKLDTKMGLLFSEAVLELLEKSKIHYDEITAIGSHGQNIFHNPNSDYPSTIQIGDPNIIAYRTKIKTVADFRRKDLAANGQGAPLAPFLHNTVFRSNSENRVIVNIGGIANVTILPMDEKSEILGFDTGPGNCLMDLNANKYFNKSFDNEGTIAKSGKVIDELLNKWLECSFFRQLAPKSTGRELFNEIFIGYVNNYEPKDIQATLLELSAVTISDSIKNYSPFDSKVYICGGGAKNTHLISRLGSLLEQNIETTLTLGIDPAWVEACLFALLAKARLENKISNISSVTGGEPVVLGGVYI